MIHLLKGLSVALLLVLSLGACSEKVHTPLVPADYSDWARVNRIELDYPIPGHMDQYRVIYINDTGSSVAITDRNGRLFYDFPEGTIIIKEIYSTLNPSEDEDPHSLTVMIKNPDHPDAREEWLWIVKDTASGDESVISQEFCITCHSNANEEHPYNDGNMNNDFRDFVFFPYQD